MKKLIIGLMGQAGSGKDTFADQLISKYHYAKVALADPLKRFCKDVYGFTNDQLWGPSDSRNAPDERYPRICKRCNGSGEYDDQVCLDCDANGTTYLTPRFALQLLGTEWGRICYPNTWVDYAIRIATEIVNEDENTDGGVVYTPYAGLEFRNTGARYKGVIIPDCRFQNEVDAIHKVGGIVVQLIRAGKDGNVQGGITGHASEKEQKSVKNVDHIIHVAEGHDKYWHQIDEFMEKVNS